MMSKNNHLPGSNVAVIFDVVPDSKAFRFIDTHGHGVPVAAAPSLLEGTIFTAGSRNQIGKFTRAGMFTTPEHEGDHQFIHEAFRIEGRGTIFVVGFIPGVCPSGDGLRRAVIGGTGEFAGVRGEALIEPQTIHGNGDAFRVTITVSDDKTQQDRKLGRRFDWRGILDRFFPASIPRAPRAAMAFGGGSR